MIRRPKRRDKCEKAIITAMRAIGASVSQLDGEPGLPDLLVGYQGRTYLMECKDPDDGDRNSRAGGKRVSNPLGLRDSQWAWRQAWRGHTPIVVTTPSEAIAALTSARDAPTRE